MFTDTNDPDDRSLTTDNRAVSEVLGAILIFGLIIAVIALIQLNAVPAANKQVETEHNNRVTQDFETLQETLYRVGSTGSTGAVTVETGVSYPPRFFLLNPGPKIGSLGTTGTQPVTIEGATATGEVGDYWNGDPIPYATTGIGFNPIYSEYRNPARLRWEHGTMYSRFDRGQVLVNNPSSFVDGRNVRLTLLEGSVGANGLSTVVELSPISTRQRTVSLTNSTSDPISITVGTDLPTEQWEEVLATEPHASVAGSDDTAGTVTIQLQAGLTYDLSVAKLRLGPTATSTTAEYLTDVSGDGVTIGEGGSQRLVVEARDEFNNPVSGTDINATVISGLGTVSTVNTDRTDNEGRVALRYDPPANVDGDTPVTVEAIIAGTTTEQERVTFDLVVLDSDNSGGPPSSDTDGVSQINPGEGAVRLSDVDNVAGQGSGFSFTFTNDGDLPKGVDEMRLLFATQNDQSASLEWIKVTSYTKNGVETPLSGEPRLDLYEEFSDVTNVAIQPDEDVTVTFTTDKNNIGGDLVAISIVYADGTIHNYFGQVPQN